MLTWSARARLAAAVSAATASAAAAVASSWTVSHRSAQCDNPSHAEREHFNCDVLRHWLQERRADVSSIAFAHDKGKGNALIAGPNIRQRYGRYAWLRPLQRLHGAQQPTIAAFPASAVINAGTVQQDPLLGDALGSKLASGAIDATEAVQIWLMVHSKLGRESPYHGYLQSLPADINTPAFWSEQQLAELQGTFLHRAVQGRQAQLSAGWDRARSVLQELQTAGRLPNGVHAASFTRGDWHWAAGTLLSRAVALPLSETSQDETITSLVPGLDMANHSPARNCFWQVTGSLLDGSASIELKALRRLQAGEELCLTYGRDGNDALLFKYGFVDDNNPNDVCTLPCPLEHVDNSRLQSLQEAGLLPSVSLPRSRQSAYEVLSADDKVILRTLYATRTGEASLPTSSAAQSNPDSNRQVAEMRQLADEVFIHQQFASMLRSQLSRFEASKVGGGTGPLADDVSLLQDANLAPESWACVVYRAGQKRIVHEYLKLAEAQVEQLNVQIARTIKQLEASSQTRM